MSSTRLAEWGVVAFHRGYAEVGGGPLEGLFLSQGVYWQGRTDDPDGWFYKTQEAWEIEAHLSRRNLGTVRDKLKKRGLLEEQLQGIPAKMHYRINIEKLEQLVADLPTPPKPGDRNKKKKEEETRANKFVRNEQTGMTETSKQDCSKAPNITKTTAETTSETTSEKNTTTLALAVVTHAPAPALGHAPAHTREEKSPSGQSLEPTEPDHPEPAPVPCGGEDDDKKGKERTLIFPEGLGNKTLGFARNRIVAMDDLARYIGHAGDLAQDLLDEWTGHLRGAKARGEPVTNPIGYLTGIMRKAYREGVFELEAGIAVREARDAERRAAEREARSLREACRKDPEPPPSPANPRDRPEGLRQLKGVLNKRVLQNHHHQER